MLSIADALERIKGRVTDAVPEELIRQLAHEVGHRWRERDLGPVVTIHLFLQQVLYGNTAVAHLRRLSSLDFTDAAYCQARARLPGELFQRLQQAVTDDLRADGDHRPQTRWHGHRTFLLDGSSFSMPDTPALREHFGQPASQAEGCGFPTAHLLTLFDAYRGYLLRAAARPVDTHDMSQAAAMHAELCAGDVLVGDRAFASYAHLALCLGRGIHGLFRAHQRQIIDFQPGRAHLPPGVSPRGQAGRPRSRWLKRLGRHDQRVEYYKPKERPEWLTPEQYAALPASIVVRELRYPVRVPGYRTREVTLVTTLLDPEAYPAEELAVFALAYNLVRRVMEEAGRRQGVEAERISFVDALRWLQEARPGDELPELVVNPDRPGRVQPRVRKRRPKQYTLMTRPRDQLRKALLGQRPAA